MNSDLTTAIRICTVGERVSCSSAVAPDRFLKTVSLRTGPTILSMIEYFMRPPEDQVHWFIGSVKDDRVKVCVAQYLRDRSWAAPKFVGVATQTVGGGTEVTGVIKIRWRWSPLLLAYGVNFLWPMGPLGYVAPVVLLLGLLRCFFALPLSAAALKDQLELALEDSAPDRRSIHGAR